MDARIFVLALSGWATAVWGQQVETVSVVPQWKKGETRLVEMAVQRVRYDSAGRPVAFGDRVFTLTPARLTVLKAGDAGYTVRWRQGAAQAYFDTFPLPSPSAGEPLLETLNQPLDFVFKTDPDGKILALANWKSLKTRLVASMRKRAQSEAQKRLVALMESRMKTEAGVRLMLATLPETYFSGFLGEVYLQDTVEYATNLGGFPAVGRIVVSGYEPDSGLVRIVTSVVPDILDDRFVAWVRETTGAQGSVSVETLQKYGRRLGLRDERTIVYDVYARRLRTVHLVRTGKIREEILMQDAGPQR
jgi:hypothetical protein